MASHPWYWSEKNKSTKIKDYPICVLGCGWSVDDQMIHILCECTKFKSNIIEDENNILHISNHKISKK